MSLTGKLRKTLAWSSKVIDRFDALVNSWLTIGPRWAIARIDEWVEVSETSFSKAPLLWLLPPLLYVAWRVVFYTSIEPNPDAYYHLDIARLYALQGWVEQYTALPYTVLGAESFPNAYVLSHLLLAPLWWLFSEPDTVMKAALSVSGVLTVLTYFYICRNMPIRAWWWWGCFGLAITDISLLYLGFIKGMSLGIPFLLLGIYATIYDKRLLLFCSAVLFTLSYVGAVVLVALTGLWVFCVWIVGGSVQTRLVLLALAGFVLGLILNPYFPESALMMVRELYSSQYMSGHPQLTPGVWVGAEWQALTARGFIASLWPLAALMGLLLVGMFYPTKDTFTDQNKVQVLNSQYTAPAALAALFILVILSALIGTKFLLVSSLFAIVALPTAFASSRLWENGFIRLVCIAVLLWSFSIAESKNLTDTKAVKAISEYLANKLEPGEVVYTPWETFPQMNFYLEDAQFIAGMNIYFLAYPQHRQFTGPLADDDDGLTGPTFNDYYNVYSGAAAHRLATVLVAEDSKYVITRAPEFSHLYSYLEQRPENFQEIDVGTGGVDGQYRLFEMVEIPYEALPK